MKYYGFYETNCRNYNERGYEFETLAEAIETMKKIACGSHVMGRLGMTQWWIKDESGEVIENGAIGEGGKK